MRHILVVTIAFLMLVSPCVVRAQGDAQDLIWPRLVANMRLVNDEQNEIVALARRYARNAGATQQLLARAEPFLWHITEAIERYGLPAELALVPAVESGFNPGAASAVDARGLWQLLPSTGRSLGLTVTRHHDARRDPLQSTDAALRHLRSLYAHYHDWHLALAAYNLGQARLSSTLRRVGHDADFWGLKLPKETFEYVRRVIAMALIVEQPERFGVGLPDIKNAPVARAY